MVGSFMDGSVGGSPTKEGILMLIKKHGGLSVEELSRYVGITPMGVRQHLVSLEKGGLITYDIRKQGIGRPVFIYRLTEEADGFFPKTYDSFLVGMLESLEDGGGRDKLRDVFRGTMERLYSDRREAFLARATVGDRVSALAGVLEDEGRMVDLTHENGKYSLKVYNCPIIRVAELYNDACVYELEQFGLLVGSGEIDRTSCLATGDPSCTFNVTIQ